MTPKEFNGFIDKFLSRTFDVLTNKGDEYGKANRFHNFEQAAHLSQIDRKQALAGMMSKHTVSLYDMCHSGESYPVEVWNEKIIDHINYLCLLRAIVEQESELMVQADVKEDSEFEPYMTEAITNDG